MSPLDHIGNIVSLYLRYYIHSIFNFVFMKYHKIPFMKYNSYANYHIAIFWWVNIWIKMKTKLAPWWRWQHCFSRHTNKKMPNKKLQIYTFLTLLLYILLRGKIYHLIDNDNKGNSKKLDIHSWVTLTTLLSSIFEQKCRI